MKVTNNIREALETLNVIEKGKKTGTYLNTAENRKLGRVGQKYIKEDSQEQKTLIGNTGQQAQQKLQEKLGVKSGSGNKGQQAQQKLQAEIAVRQSKITSEQKGAFDKKGNETMITEETKRTYIAAINTMMALGATEKQARKLAQQAMKDAVKNITSEQKGASYIEDKNA